MAATSWPEALLGDHVDLLTGHPFKSKQFTDEDSDIRLLRGDNVAQGYLRWENAKRWDASEYSSFEKYHLQKGDVILAMDRPWITAGLKYAWVCDQDLPSLLVQRVARLRGSNGLLTEYVRCLVGSPAFTDHVLSIITGVNVPHISGRDIKAFRFLLPPLETQKKVAEIVTAYDDLIENNTRRIAILEEMARRLYEEWFVHFRFPGHEDATFTETEHGRIPEGWGHCQLDEISAFISRGVSPKYDEDAECRVINQKCIRDQRLNMDHSRRQSKNVPEAKSVQFGDVLINSTGVGTLGRVAQVQEQLDKVTVDSHVTIARANSTMDKAFYGQQLLHLQPHFEDQGVGATGQTELSKTRVSETLVLCPSQPIQSRFGDMVGPVKKQIQVLLSKNANLRAQRDLLLPKLVSGEIDVGEAEKSLEAAE